MNTETIKNIIADSRIVAKSVVLNEREYFFEDACNYIITGIRRSGKTSCMYLKMKQLVESGVSWDQIVFINFEDERIIGITLDEMNLIIEAQSEMNENKAYYFFDEIQNVVGWERFVRRLADMNLFVWVTGSNSEMLSREMDRVLGGRLMTKQIYPYDFREYCRALEVDIDSHGTISKGRLKAVLNDYMHFGGFPGSVELVDKRSYVDSIYKKIYLGDISARHGIRNDKSLRILIRKLAESVESEISCSRLHNILKAASVDIGKTTVKNYIDFAKESYLIFSIENYVSKIVEKECNPKYYFMDNGLLNLFLDNNDTALLENLVAVTLYRKYGDRLYYIRGKREVDFYIPDESIAIQVSYSIEDYQTRKREIASLVDVAKTFGADTNIIVTMNESGEEVVDGVRIAIIPIYDFLKK